MTEHAAEMKHTDFTLDVYGFSLILENITDGTAKKNKKPVSLEIKVIKNMLEKDGR